MSKAKVLESVGEFMEWLPNYDQKYRDAMIKALASFLGDLPGGDRWEDMGYETLGFSWHELEMVSDILVSVEDSFDNELVTELLFADDDDDEEEDE